MKIEGSTKDWVQKVARQCCERADSIRANRKYPLMQQRDIEHELNTMALNYFIGATALAGTLGITPLVVHLKHVLVEKVNPHGMKAVEELARRSLVAVSKPSTITNDNKEQ